MLSRYCLFKGGSAAIQSPHDGDGELHLAFAISATELASWEGWLAENGIAVEEKRAWKLGGHHFRDPDRHPDRARYAGCLVVIDGVRVHDRKCIRNQVLRPRDRVDSGSKPRQ